MEKQGKIDEIIYRNEDNGYTVAIFQTEDEEFSIVGIMPFCAAGSSYKISGDFVTHPKYGEQFKVVESVETMPNGVEAIEDFLASGIIAGVGPSMAKRIIDKFGEDALTVIENAPERLTLVNGIGPAKMKSIYDSYMEKRIFADIAIFFRQYEVKPNFAFKLYKFYGADVIEKVKNDPYILIDDFYEIGFKKADAIAERLGVAKDDERRIRSGIRALLIQLAVEGHCCYPRTEFIEKAAEMLELQCESIDDELIFLNFGGDVKIDKIDGEEVVYLTAYYNAERNVASRLYQLNSATPSFINANLDSLVEQSERTAGMQFSEEQRRAIFACISNGVTVITGGPGTGKTTIIRGIINILEASNSKVLLAAPTGRAAKRIMETTGHFAMTLHRMLGYTREESSGRLYFTKNEDEALDCDALIVDEASMIDLMLMQGLCMAMRPGMRLILVGDADQLPSVSAGNVLKDIIDSEYVYSVCLHEIFRQAKESMIVTNAHKINCGEYPDCNVKDKDFFMLGRESEAEMAETIVDLLKRRLPASYGLDPISDIQVLTPRRRGNVGCVELNKKLQAELNPPCKGLAEKKYGDRIFRVGDKVMQIKNNYEIEWIDINNDKEGTGIFNGDVGFVTNINKEKGELTVVFDDEKNVTYNQENLEELEIAYAVTVHKAQGSEFPVIVMPMSWCPPMLGTRNMLYTGVTRGKKIVILVGSRGRMQAMVDNVGDRNRYTGLRARLKGLLNDINKL